MSAPDQIIEVYLDDIEKNPWNPHGMTEQELSDLKESLREHGQWRPIIVVEMDQADEHTPRLDSEYRIVDGEHLHKAMVSNYLAGTGPQKAKVFVYGKNSEVPAWKQMEIGQTVNHGLRGSIEDAKKTGQIVAQLIQHRTLDEVARRTGQSLNFLEASRRTLDSAPVRRMTAPTRVNGERKGQTVPLVFEDNDTLSRYNAAIRHWEKVADPDGELTPGRRRISAVLAALEAAGSPTGSPVEAEQVNL